MSATYQVGFLRVNMTYMAPPKTIQLVTTLSDWHESRSKLTHLAPICIYKPVLLCLV